MPLLFRTCADYSTQPWSGEGFLRRSAAHPGRNVEHHGLQPWLQSFAAPRLEMKVLNSFNESKLSSRFGAAILARISELNTFKEAIACHDAA
jgi:hypothetical protein